VIRETQVAPFSDASSLIVSPLLSSTVWRCSASQLVPTVRSRPLTSRIVVSELFAYDAPGESARLCVGDTDTSVLRSQELPGSPPDTQRPASAVSKLSLKTVWYG
jgi:hypothetical protein